MEWAYQNHFTYLQDMQKTYKLNMVDVMLTFKIHRPQVDITENFCEDNEGLKLSLPEIFLQIILLKHIPTNYK